MAFATVDSHLITALEIYLPQSGVWWGDLQTDDGVQLSGQVTITLGDLQLMGTVRRGGVHAGAGGYRIEGGGAGWSTQLPARAYRSDSGVYLSTVLEDTALACGETLASGYEDRWLGTAFVRGTQPAQRVLNGLCGADGWYLGTDGETVLGRRPGGTVGVSYEVVDYDQAERLAVLATETPSAFMPGQTIEVEGAQHVISNVMLSIADGVLRVYCWCAAVSAEDRLRASLAAIVRETFPNLIYLGTYEYRVVTQSDNQLNLQPVSAAVGLPDLERVPMRPGIPGANAEVKLGSLVLVTFVNADPARPVVVGFEDPDGEGFVSPLVSIDADQIDLGDAVGRALRSGNIVDITGVQPGPGITAAVITLNVAELTPPTGTASKVFV